MLTRTFVILLIGLSIFILSSDGEKHRKQNTYNHKTCKKNEKQCHMAKFDGSRMKTKNDFGTSTIKAHHENMKIYNQKSFDCKSEGGKYKGQKKHMFSHNLTVVEKYDINDAKEENTVTRSNESFERLTEPKLKSLYMELKIQDKEEIQWKQLNAEHKDKEGLKAAALRQKLMGIMSTYDLLDHFEDTQNSEKTKPFRKFHESDDHLNKSLFKDKKLNKLWEKAEISGFSADELKSLKEEFLHHQDKVDVYYSLLEEVGSMPSKTDKHENEVDEEQDAFNIIQSDTDNEIRTPEMEKNIYHENINKLRDSHRGIKDHYDRLERMVSSGPHSQDFIEPKVQGLWRVALTSDFSEKELASIKAELHHFETRLLKLRNLHAEHAMQKEKYKKAKQNDKNDRFEEMEQHIKKQTRKVEKIQETLEAQIFKHTEL